MLKQKCLRNASIYKSTHKNKKADSLARVRLYLFPSVPLGTSAHLVSKELEIAQAPKQEAASVVETTESQKCQQYISRNG